MQRFNQGLAPNKSIHDVCVVSAARRGESRNVKYWGGGGKRLETLLKNSVAPNCVCSVLPFWLGFGESSTWQRSGLARVGWGGGGCSPAAHRAALV